MRTAASRGAGLREGCLKLFGFPGLLALCPLHERKRREEDVYAERSTQGPVQGDPKGSGQREKSGRFEATANIVSPTLEHGVRDFSTLV